MYECKSCGSVRIIERTSGIIRDAEVYAISVEGRLQCNNPQFIFSSSKLEGYFCLGCGAPLIDVDDANRNRTRSEGDLIKLLLK